MQNEGSLVALPYRISFDAFRESKFVTEIHELVCRPDAPALSPRLLLSTLHRSLRRLQDRTERFLSRRLSLS